VLNELSTVGVLKLLGYQSVDIDAKIGQDSHWFSVLADKCNDGLISGKAEWKTQGGEKNIFCIIIFLAE